MGRYKIQNKNTNRKYWQYQWCQTPMSMSMTTLARRFEKIVYLKTIMHYAINWKNLHCAGVWTNHRWEPFHSIKPIERSKALNTFSAGKWKWIKNIPKQNIIRCKWFDHLIKIPWNVSSFYFSTFFCSGTLKRIDRAVVRNGKQGGDWRSCKQAISTSYNTSHDIYLLLYPLQYPPFAIFFTILQYLSHLLQYFSINIY